MASMRFPPGASRAARACITAGIGAVLVGGAGFAAGFFGPLALNPEANQGPLVGILITGPGGALLGALLGGSMGLAGLQPSAISRALIGTSVLLAGGTLCSVLPGPQFRGNVLELRVTRCQRPASLEAEAFAHWDRRIAEAHWAAPRPNWKEDFESMVASDRGVVISATVTRSAGLYENRKPWNRGTHQPGKAWWVGERYFVRGSSCASWPAGRSGIYVAAGDRRTSRAWPTDVLPSFLDLQVLSPATREQAALLR